MLSDDDEDDDHEDDDHDHDHDNDEDDDHDHDNDDKTLAQKCSSQTIPIRKRLAQNDADARPETLISELFKQVCEEYKDGYVVEYQLRPRKINFQTYLMLSEGLNFEELQCQQDIQMLDYFVRRTKHSPTRK